MALMGVLPWIVLKLSGVILSWEEHINKQMAHVPNISELLQWCIKTHLLDLDIKRIRTGPIYNFKD